MKGGSMKETHNAHTTVNLVADGLLRTTRLLEKGKRKDLTRAELHEVIDAALLSVRDTAKTLMKPRSVLSPIIAGDADNSLFDELVKLGDDMGTVQYMLAHGNIKDADRLLAEIKKRV